MMHKDELERTLRNYLHNQTSLEATVLLLFERYNVSTWSLKEKKYEDKIYELTTMLVGYKFNKVNKFIYHLYNLATDVETWLEENRDKLR